MSIRIVLANSRWWATLLSSLLIVAFAVFTGGSGCPPVGDDDDDNDDATDDDDTADDDDDTGIEPFSLAGDVYLIPVKYEDVDDDDVLDRVEMEWSEVGGYTYGRVYVGITSSFDDAANPLLHFTAPTVPADPKNDPTPYSFSPVTWPLAEVCVMAIADTWYDTVISPWDSLGFHADTIDTTGPPVLDADIFVDVVFDADTGNIGGGGGTGGGYPVTIGGQIELNESAHVASTGNSLVGVYDASDNGPYWLTLPGVLDGADQNNPLDWSMVIDAPFTANMRGAWDWNNNGLFEPGDDWGVTVDNIGGSQVNPWDITGDVGGMIVQVPLIGATPPLPDPYVRVSGIVQTDGSFEFSDLDPDDGVVVYAAREAAVEGDTLGELIGSGEITSYDFIPNVAALGMDQIPYEVWVPTHTTSFLMAGTDVDGDGNYAADPTEDVVAVHADGADMTRNITLTHAPTP